MNEEVSSGLAKHRMVAHFKANHKVLPLYSSEYGDNEGLYFFGGVFGKGTENGLLFMAFNAYNPVLRRLEYTGILPSSLNDNLIALLSGENHDRELKVFKIREREFVGIHRYENTPYFGGIGCTLSNYEGKLLILFGYTDEGYSSEVVCLEVTEKVVESENKNNKVRKESIEQWRLWKKEVS